MSIYRLPLNGTPIRGRSPIGGQSETDPYFNNVSLLLHMNGANASTAFTDVKGKAITANGNAQISTAFSKFGGASGLFDGSGDGLQTPDTTDLDLDSEDFTIECWVYFNALTTGLYCILGKWLSSTNDRSYGIFIDYPFNNSFRLYFYLTTSGIVQPANTVTGPVLSTSQWYHLAASRSGNNTYLYVDGTQYSGTITGALKNSAGNFTIGQTHIGSSYLNGYVDEVRVTKGINRYTTSFSPPTAPFPDS